MNPGLVLSRRDLVLAGLATGLAGCTRTPSTVGAAAGDSAAATPEPPPRAIDAPDIVAAAVLLPGLVDSSTEGPLIDLMRALAATYPRGRMQIEAMPLARAVDSVVRGTADVGFPLVRTSRGADGMRPYRCSTTPLGSANFVLYSHKSRPLSFDGVRAAIAAPTFNLWIEAPAFDWGFPTQPFSNLESALRKISAGRIDALLWGQEAADNELRRLGLADIHRENYGDYDDVFLLPHGARGDFVDGVLTAAIDQLRRSGALAALYRRIHRPHDAWQP